METSKIGVDLSALSEALRHPSMAAQNAIQALNGMDIQKAIQAIQSISQRDLIALIQKQREDERWRNDPLQLKSRFLDPIPMAIADTLRAIAFLIDP